MRLVHTADWHLGRIFYGQHLTGDQAHLLDQLFELLREQRADALLVAGDVYDRAVPPPEAVELLSELVARVTVDLGLSIVMIAGNHDSPDRLSFAARILRERGLHIFGELAPSGHVVTLEDAHGPVAIHALPYSEPAHARQVVPEADPRGHAEATKALIELSRRAHPSGARSVLVAHAFVEEGEKSESERPLTVGGAGTVPASVFDGFDYVALGHLHRPQRLGERPVCYSGSLMPYAFSEAIHDKSVTVVELDAQGACHVERVALTPRRQVRCVEGHLAQLLEGPAPGQSRHDYLKVSLLDRDAILDAMGQLRAVYPNVLHLEWSGLEVDGALEVERGDPRKRDDAELFAAFYQQVCGQPLEQEQAELFRDVADALRAADRER